jgi:hypothetical protein
MSSDEEDLLHRDQDQLALGGEELEEYCKKHGLCNLCAKTRTHKRAFRLKKKNQWQPLTVESKNGEYIVYRGYCVQPVCFTLDQAKRLLGEIGPTDEEKESSLSSSSSSFSNNDDNNKPSKEKKGLRSRLLMRGNSTKSRNKTAKYANSGGGASFDGMTGFSATGGGGKKSRRGGKSSGSSSTRSVSTSSSEIRRDDDDVSVAASAMTSASKVRTSLHQLLKDNAGTMLDLSSTRLHHNHVTELVSSLNVANTLQTLILENCKLNDNEIEVLGNGLGGNDMVAPIRRISFRSNRLGNRGACSLQTWLQKTPTLEELDLSKNQIGSRGATSILHAFRDNHVCPIKMLNFAHNEIWDPDDGTFFATNTTLELINLEGNFIHDEGIEAIAKGIRANRRCKLEKLYLGWNGIGDEGCIQLAYMLESNKSLNTLGLGENDITSVGARALLSSLASNSTLRDITGLYHNQIDRKFIVAAIKRLLHSHVEKLGSTEYKLGENNSAMFEASMSAMETLAEPLGSPLDAPEEMSEGSLDWAEKLYAPGEEAGNKPPPIGEINAPGVPLGNFDTKMEHNEYCRCETCVKAKGKAAMEEAPIRPAPAPIVSQTNGRNSGIVRKSVTFKQLPPPKTDFDRLTVFQSAPLAYFNRETSIYHPVPLHDFDHETTAVRNALKEAEKLETTIELEVEPGHPDRLRTFFDKGTSRVLHLSCYGHPDHLAFENGAGNIETMAVEELRTLVKAAKAGSCPLQLVVVNSFHSGRIGKAFFEAGVPHVVCCHHTEVFRDKAASGFVKSLYRALASNKSLKQAFYMAQEAVRVEEICKHVDRYVLLPRKAEDDPYHDVPIFYTGAVPPIGLRENEEEEEEQALEIIPRLPKHFIGREVDMYEVLEALRVDDVVRVGGLKGSGKTSLVAAVCRYINQRKKMFNYDDVFWLPAAQGVLPDEDTLFWDLCQLMEKIMKADHDIWEDEDAMECRERIEIELEGRRTILAIDGRKFHTEMASQNLETFLGELLNSDVDVKVILTTTAGENKGFDQEEEDTINLGPIDFKSNALLFGEVSRFITANGCPAAQSPDEFAALMVPPSVAKLQDQTKFSSSRRTHLMGQMGKGNPLDVIKAGKNMPASTFIQLIGRANTPEVRVDSFKTLVAAVARWTGHMEVAVKSKNYLRATDLRQVLVELEALRPTFPSLDDLIRKEQELQRTLSLAMSNKQYTAGNTIKREILALKRVIMQEKRSAPAENERSASDRVADLQNQMQAMMKIAHSSFSDMDNLVDAPEISAASFSLGSAYHHCEVAIYPGSVVYFEPGDDMGAVICWTNECCDMELHDNSRQLIEYGGPNLAKDIGSLPGITKTRWGLAKCGTGNAVIVGPGNYDDLNVNCVILAVGPLSPSCEDDFPPDDEDSLHYIQIMMRSCIRSGLILAKHSQVQSVAFPTLTSKQRAGGATYEQTLLMGLKILVEEAKHSDLNNLHIVAKNEEESTKLIAMAIDMGLVMS